MQMIPDSLLQLALFAPAPKARSFHQRRAIPGPALQASAEIKTGERKAKDRGMRVAASAHHTDLRLAREIARELGQDGEEVWADLVRVEMLMRFPDVAWGNWAGSIFTGGEWAFVGYTKSTAPGSHSHLLRLWVLKAEGREVAP